MQVCLSHTTGDNRFVNDLVSYNGMIMAATSVQLPALSAAALYGKGVFTTLAIYGGMKDYWFEHWRRLSRDAVKIGVDISTFDLESTGRAIDELIHRNNVSDGRARVTFFDESSTELWPARLTNNTNMLITTAGVRAAPGNFKLTVSPFGVNSTSPLAGVKSCNYLDKILAKSEALDRGFHECIRLNEREEVVSGAMANVFWVKDGQFFTPSLKTGCVPGITRLQVMEGRDCLEVEADIAELKSADEIFLTSAGFQAARVAEFDGLKLKRDSEEIHWLFVRF